MVNGSKIKEKVRRLTNKPGVYIMRDRLGRVIYVGKAKNLKKRVSSYFYPEKINQLRELYPKIATMISLVDDFDIIEVKSEVESLILESQLIKQWKPKYNTIAKDDKRFLMIRVDIQNTLPQFRLTRNRTDHKSVYFGPFTNPVELKTTLRDLRMKFGILLGDTHPQKIGDKLFKLYDDVRGEIYGHPNEVTIDEYQERVDNACSFLQGKSHDYLQAIEGQMKAASAKRDYEKAAELRDLILAIKKTLEPHRKFTSQTLIKAPIKTPTTEAPVISLGRAIGLANPPKDIECFDISHISGTFVVASMVHFTNGVPDKAKYRRYKIRTFVGNDDYRAMQEVVSRRYLRLNEEGSSLPELIVIDGGIGQVNAAMTAFLAHDLKPPIIIGLAKKRETIVFSDGRPDLNLALDSPALHLLQRIRDEAHRFANAFNAELRSKKIRESVLDDFSGLGPVRKEALLKHFKTIANLRKASYQELQEVPGIGPKIAEELHNFLKTN